MRLALDARSLGPRIVAELGDSHNIVALLIAVVSVLSAIVAWRASVSDATATELFVRYPQELIQQELRRVEWDGIVEQDLRFFAQYRAHVRAWRLLEQQARKAQDLTRRVEFDLKAQDELALARAKQAYFRAKTPTFEVADVYDRESALADALAQDQIYQRLHPDATHYLAERAHAQTLGFDFIFAVFIASLFFLTIASLRRNRFPDPFVLAGVIVALLGLTGWGLVWAKPDWIMVLLMRL